MVAEPVVEGGISVGNAAQQEYHDPGDQDPADRIAAIGADCRWVSP
jgi:hypothetical protein